jgi:hypothetical protein
MKRAFVFALAVALLVAGAVAHRLAAQNAQTPPRMVGRVSDAAAVQALLKPHNVPGVSIAVIKDFAIVATYAYGVADAVGVGPFAVGFTID